MRMIFYIQNILLSEVINQCRLNTGVALDIRQDNICSCYTD